MRYRHALFPLITLVAMCGVLLAPALAGAAGGTPLPSFGSPVEPSIAASIAGTPLRAAETSAGKSSVASVTAAGDAIVAITSGAERTGSGVMISPGRILTSTRVLKQNDPTVKIMTVDGGIHDFTIVARDDALGLVLLAADVPGVTPIAGWHSAGTMIAGDAVHILGLASGAREVLDMKGTVSSPAAATGGDLILTDVKLDPLVEGGALVSTDGKLAGIVTAKGKSPELGEIGWAVTSDAARQFIAGIAERQKAKAAEDAATVIRRWVVRAVLLVFAGIFVLFGWWFRRWYKAMEAREAAAAATDRDALSDEGAEA